MCRRTGTAFLPVLQFPTTSLTPLAGIGRAVLDFGKPLKLSQGHGLDLFTLLMRLYGVTDGPASGGVPK
jgi:hypothetical protein